MSTRAFSKYSEHKATGSQWVTSAPYSWRIGRLKHAINQIESGKRDLVDYSEILSIGGEHINSSGRLNLHNPRYVSEKLFKTSTKGKVQDGDILVVKDGATIGKTAFIETTNGRRMLLNEHVYRIDSNKFYYYYILSSFFQAKIWSENTGSAQEGLNLSTIKNITALIPPVHEQTQIAKFLDHETAKIDVLIEKQQQLIALLKEKRQAVISHAVTKGLNPDAPMRDSGVEWLGEVPGHWEVMAIKRLVSVPVTDGPHETPTFIDDGIPFLSAEGVSSGVINFNRVRGFISEALDAEYSKKYSPKRHDIFMVKSGATTGVTAIVETDKHFNIWSPLAAIRCNADTDPHFTLFFLRSRNFQEAIELNWSFGTQQNIGMGVIENLHVARPPLKEANEIAVYLRDMCARVDAISERAEQQVAILQERRTALISAAVTGKIDVRDWSPDPAPAKAEVA